MATLAEWEYNRVEIALLTHWTLEYIDGLGLVDSESILQIAEAKAKLAQVK